MTSCSHHGDRNAHRVCFVQQRAPMLDQLARRLGKRLAAPRLELDLRRDQLARRVLAQGRGVGARLELGEAVDQAQRLGVDDLELLLDREGQILRAGEARAGLVERLQRVGDALAHRRERTSAFVRQTREKAADTARGERSRGAAGVRIT
jgi:hypothetical protein